MRALFLAALTLLIGCSRPAEPAPPPLASTAARNGVALENQLARGTLSRFGLTFPLHATVGRETPSSVEVVVPANVARVEAFLSPSLRAAEIEHEGGKTLFVDATVVGDSTGANFTVVLKPDGARTRVVVRRENIPTPAEVALLPEPVPDPKPTIQVDGPPDPGRGGVLVTNGMRGPQPPIAPQ